MHGRILMKDLEEVDGPSGFNSFCFQNSFFWVVCFLGLPKAYLPFSIMIPYGYVFYGNKLKCLLQTIDEGSSSSFPLKIDVESI